MFPTSDLCNSTRLFDFGKALKSVASLYPKLELKNGTIFTTFPYSRSPKRSNYLAFMQDSTFIQIESIIFLPDLPEHSLILGYSFGNTRTSYFVPDAIQYPILDPIMIPKVPGQIVKLEGTCPFLQFNLCLKSALL